MVASVRGTLQPMDDKDAEAEMNSILDSDINYALRVMHASTQTTQVAVINRAHNTNFKNVYMRGHRPFLPLYNYRKFPAEKYLDKAYIGVQPGQFSGPKSTFVSRSTGSDRVTNQTLIDTTSKPGFEKLFEETSKITHPVETLINSAAALGTALHDILMTGSLDCAEALNNPLLTPALKEIAKIVAMIQDEFRSKFPLPSTALGHTQRTEQVSKALDHLRRVVIRLARSQGIEPEVIERHLVSVEPFIRDALVLIGDIAELYPAVVEALVLGLGTVLL